MRIGRASRPRPGESVCGDQTLVLEVGSATLVAVIDGLGHGPEAAQAAGEACAAIRTKASATLVEVLFHCDRVLRGTRGAAVTLLRIDPASGSLSHAAIGNVQVAASARNRLSMIATPGVVGARFRRVSETAHRVAGGDLLVIHTDGIAPSFSVQQLRDLSPQAAADRLLDQFALDRDDATCVVIAC